MPDKMPSFCLFPKPQAPIVTQTFYRSQLSQELQKYTKKEPKTKSFYGSFYPVYLRKNMKSLVLGDLRKLRTSAIARDF
jgi:hypothetical protein